MKPFTPEMEDTLVERLLDLLGTVREQVNPYKAAYRNTASLNAEGLEEVVKTASEFNDENKDAQKGTSIANILGVPANEEAIKSRLGEIRLHSERIDYLLTALEREKQLAQKARNDLAMLINSPAIMKMKEISGL